jgi:hypothetical protein
MDSKFCSNCQSPIADGTTLCPACGAAVGEAAPARPRVTAVAAKVPVRVKLYLGVDGTGSTEPFAEGAARTAEGILSPVEAKAAGVLCSVFRCGDQEWREPVVTLCENLSPRDAIAAVRSIKFEGGGDAEETHLLNFSDILNVIPPAEPCERNAFVAITTASSKPLAGQSPTDLGQEFRARDIIVCVVGQQCALLKEFVQAAGGFYFELSNDPRADELARVAAKVAASITASLSTAQKTRRIPNAAAMA